MVSLDQSCFMGNKPWFWLFPSKHFSMSGCWDWAAAGRLVSDVDIPGIQKP